MQVKLNTIMAGPDGSCDAGKNAIVSNALGERLIKDGNARRISESLQELKEEIQDASVKAPENAELRSKKEKKRNKKHGR